MTGNETLALLAYMSAAWPSVEVTEDTARVWSQHLEKIDGNDALAAADVLINESKWFPSIAEFREQVLRAAKRRREVEYLDDPKNALPSGGRTEAEKEHARKCLAEARRLVAQNAWKPARKVEGFKTLGESLGAVLESKSDDF